MAWFCELKLFWLCAWCSIAAGCSDQLWFQTSISNHSTLLAVEAKYNHLPLGLSRDNVRNASDCARLCYNDPVCKSAVYIPDNNDVSETSMSIVQEKTNKRGPNEDSVQMEEIEERNGKGGLCISLPSGPDCDAKSGGLVSQTGLSTRPVLMYCFTCSPSWTNSTATKDERFVSMDTFRMSVPRESGRVVTNETMSNHGESTSDDGNSRKRTRRERARTQPTHSPSGNQSRVEFHWHQSRYTFAPRKVVNTGNSGCNQVVTMEQDLEHKCCRPLGYEQERRGAFALWRRPRLNSINRSPKYDGKTCRNLSNLAPEHYASYQKSDGPVAFFREFSLRVMTFNTFLSGDMVERGLDKVAKHILENDPEIVFLQEMADSHIASLLGKLDNRIWSACSRNAGQLNHIVTRLDIVTEFEPSPAVWNNGCQIRLFPPNDDFVMNLWNVHLYPLNYGPYKACSKNSPIRTTNELFDCESNPQDVSRGRLENLMTLSRHEPFAKMMREASIPNGQPLIVAGDFNSPSHLDWVDAARPFHCQLMFQWPVSKMMADQLGLIDSYRSKRPDPIAHKGTTWSTIYKDSTTEFVSGRPEPEPQDRIDYIYYKGRQLRVLESWVYAGTERIGLFPNFQFNDWPSDHASVVTHFGWAAS